ncbi:hypothetical protein D3C85_394570 [compost metagenome]
MARVVAGDVVVELEVAVFFAHVPVARRGHPLDQAAVMQHRQVESRAIPAHDFWRVAFDGLEETRQQGGFGIVGLAQRLDAKTLVVAEHAAHHRHLVQVQRQEVMAHGLPARGKRAFDHFLVRHVRPPAVELAQPLGVGNGFQVEYQGGRHLGGRYCIGSTGVPWRRISKCRRGDVVSLWPSSAILAPRLTVWPVFTSTARLCA